MRMIDRFRAGNVVLKLEEMLRPAVTAMREANASTCLFFRMVRLLRMRTPASFRGVSKPTKFSSLRVAARLLKSVG